MYIIGHKVYKLVQAHRSQEPSPWLLLTQAYICLIHSEQRFILRIKRRPQVNFLAFTETFYGSPWSLCLNATYVYEKACSLLLVKGHPGEIFCNFILSPWSQCQKRWPQVDFLAFSETFFVSPWSPCQKRRPQVNFLAFTETFFVSPWSPCPNATYGFEKIIFCTACENPPRWNS